MQLSVLEISTKFHHIHAGPLKYGITMVVLVNSIVNFDYMKDTQHTLHLGNICFMVFTHQQVIIRVPKGWF